MSEIKASDSAAISGMDQSAVFNYLAKNAHQNNLAWAMWRLPGQNQKHIIVDLSGEINQVQADLDLLPEGFVLSPFANPGLGNTILIRADLQYSSGENTGGF